MNPPLKLRHGDTLATLYDKFNAVIDYLARTRIVAGNGIRVSQLPAGQTIESTATAAGGTAAAPAGGMFRVTENADGTVSVSGGLINNGLRVLPAKLTRSDPENQRYVLLLWKYPYDIFIDFGLSIDYGYIPGEQISWPLARLTIADIPFVQLWQGGMIDFTTRYYLG